MIEKTLQLPATPARVYQALTQQTAFSEMTGGAPTELTNESGDRFRLFGGMIEGRNVECLEGVRLVQAWRPKNWQQGQYSLVRFELHEREGGTLLDLTHSGFPPDQREHLSTGWDANYLEPLKNKFS